jgi:hypothetical protein
MFCYSSIHLQVHVWSPEVDPYNGELQGTAGEDGHLHLGIKDRRVPAKLVSYMWITG